MSSERLSYGPVEGLRAGRYGLRPGTAATCYRVGHTLIDTGPANQWRAVGRFVDEQHAAHDIERILLTHHHEDHAGNAAYLQEQLGVPVYAPEASIDRLGAAVPPPMYRRVVWGTPSPVEAEPVPEVMTLPDGTTLRTLQAPGHSDDMVCYLAREHDILFAGDLYVTRRPEYLRDGERVPQLVQSIRRMLEHSFDALLCGHRGVVPDGKEALRDKAKYLEALQGVVRRRHENDKLSVPAITSEILGREGWRYWVTQGDFAKQHLIASCLDRREASTD